jgi:hypothetical protein
MEDLTKTFEDAVREYLQGNRDWDSVHELAVEMEWNDQLDFPPEIRRPMEELHMVFLPDSRDDRQFLADREEIARLLSDVDRLKRDARTLGTNVVADGERALEEEEERSRRDHYLQKRMERRKKKPPSA